MPEVMLVVWRSQTLYLTATRGKGLESLHRPSCCSGISVTQPHKITGGGVWKQCSHESIVNTRSCLVRLLSCVLAVVQQNFPDTTGTPQSCNFLISNILSSRGRGHS